MQKYNIQLIRNNLSGTLTEAFKDERESQRNTINLLKYINIYNEI